MMDDEFNSTPPERLASYLSSWTIKRKREDHRFGVVACSIINLFRKEPVEPADIFPSLDRLAKRELSTEEIAAKILSVAAQLGAET